MKEQSVDDNPDTSKYGYSDKDCCELPCDRHIEEWNDDIDPGAFFEQIQKRNKLVEE